MFNLQRLGFALITGCLLIYILSQTQGLLVPWAFALVFALLLIPICQFYEGFLKRRVLSIFLSLISVSIPLLGLLFFFSWQLGNVGENLPDISEKISQAITKIFAWTNQNFGISKKEGTNYLEENLSSILNNPGQIISEGLTVSSTFLINTFLVLIYVFFLLWYRTALKNFLLLQFQTKNRSKGKEILEKIQKVVYQYVLGLTKVIGILAVLNSLGLWLIGIEYAIFWGTLAALLAIIPYIGTTIGGLLPFLYALATTGTMWQPAAVVIYYQLIQQIEGNFITPYIVGSNLRINPLVAILALLVGGLIWGIAGLILALPITAVLRILMTYINPFKPVAVLFSDQLGKKDKIDWSDLDEDRYRLSRYFFGERK